MNKTPACANCRDTGLYDACCRPHLCDCEAGQALAAELRPSSGPMYGDYPTLTPPVQHPRPLGRGYDT